MSSAQESLHYDRAMLGLQPDLSAVRVARRTVREAVEGLVDEPTADTVVLLTSELVTNAVIHARTDIRVSVWETAGRLRVAVTDDNPRLPVHGPTPVEATSGRGLMLLQALAMAWGIERCDEGKSVWFEVLLAKPAPPA